METTDVVAPEAMTGCAHAQATAQRRGEVLVRTVRIACPLRRVPLAAGIRRTTPDQPRAAGRRCRHLRYQVVVDQRVDVVELLPGRAVEGVGISWNAFTEIGLEGVGSHTHELGESATEPRDCVGLSQIENTNWWMTAAPQIAHVRLAIHCTQEPAALLANAKAFALDAD